jgi:hypothetical protein
MMEFAARTVLTEEMDDLHEALEIGGLDLPRRSS